MVAYGAVSLCRSCDARRSTVGKGIVGHSLATGARWLPSTRPWVASELPSRSSPNA